MGGGGGGEEEGEGGVGGGGVVYVSLQTGGLKPESLPAAGQESLAAENCVQHGTNQTGGSAMSWGTELWVGLTFIRPLSWSGFGLLELVGGTWTFWGKGGKNVLKARCRFTYLAFV